MMIREICRDETFLARRAETAGPEDLQTAADLLETLEHHRDGCVGMAANMIGVNRRIIAFEDAGVSESDTSRLKVEKDRDDGVLQYDVQFSVDEKEYSYDINGANGEILSADVETNGTAGQSAGAFSGAGRHG